MSKKMERQEYLFGFLYFAKVFEILLLLQEYKEWTPALKQSTSDRENSELIHENILTTGGIDTNLEILLRLDLIGKMSEDSPVVDSHIKLLPEGDYWINRYKTFLSVFSEVDESSTLTQLDQLEGKDSSACALMMLTTSVMQEIETYGNNTKKNAENNLSKEEAHHLIFLKKAHLELQNLLITPHVEGQEKNENYRNWIDMFRVEVQRDLRNYISPRAISKAVVPTSIILSMGSLGAFFGGSLGFAVGALVGKLLVSHIVPENMVGTMDIITDDLVTHNESIKTNDENDQEITSHSIRGKADDITGAFMRGTLLLLGLSMCVFPVIIFLQALNSGVLLFEPHLPLLLIGGAVALKLSLNWEKI